MKYLKETLTGFLGAAGLLVIYFGSVSAISGWNFALNQFEAFWYFIVSLAAGFGIQIGLYAHLKNVMRQQMGSGKILAVSGTTSTAAMISCCAHYLANILPIIGVAGIVSLVGQYQIELFWLGLAANGMGIVYIGKKIMASRKP